MGDVQSLKRFNKGISFLLVVIDTFSKYCWVVGLKNKRAATVADGLNTILVESKRIPLYFQTDKGTLKIKYCISVNLY